MCYLIKHKPNIVLSPHSTAIENPANLESVFGGELALDIDLRGFGDESIEHGC